MRECPYMAKDLAKINQIRAANGLPPLDQLPTDNAGDAPDEKPPVDPLKPPAGDIPPAPGTKKKEDDPVDNDIDDSRILQALLKRGVVANSIEDLLPKPDPIKAAEQREVEKLNYSLTKGLFSLKDHENFIRDKDNPRDLVFAQYYEEAKKEDPTATNEDIQAEFEEKYGIGAEPGSFKFKRGAQEIGLLAGKILQEKYKGIYSAEDAFSKHETAETAKQTRAKTILAQAPAYKQHVETIFSDLRKLKIPVGENESFEVEVPETAFNAVKELFLEADTASSQILSGYTPESLREVAYTALVSQNFPTISLEFAKQYHLKKQAGIKGIPPPVGPGTRTSTRQLTENQQKVLTDHGIKAEDLPVVAN